MSLFSNNIFLNVLCIGLFLSFFSYGESKFSSLIKKDYASKVLVINDNDSWKTFSDKETGFSVSFPCDPITSKKTIEIPQSNISISYNTYVCETNKDSVYVVSVWEYPDQVDISKPEVNLQEGFAGMLSALPESQVLLMKSSERDGFKSLEFWVKNDDIFFRGELVSVNHKLYQVFFVYRDNSEEEVIQDYSKFIESFKISEKQSVKITKTKTIFF